MNETRQLKKGNNVQFLKDCLHFLVKILLFVTSWEMKVYHCGAVARCAVVFMYYFLLSALRQYLHCHTTKFDYLKVISTIMT